MQTFFEDNWLTFNLEKDSRIISEKSLIWRIQAAFPYRTRINVDVLKQRMIEAVKRMPLGDRPYVSLSGGVDSQAACLLLSQAAIKFEIAILEFEDEFNSMDTQSAIDFCKANGFEYTIFKMDVLSFLTRELHDYVMKYECPSPQFNAHFKFFERLIAERQPTSIICGGNAPFIQGGKWVFNTSRSQNAWTVFAEKNEQLMIGNFLGYSFDIAFPLMMATEEIDSSDEGKRYLAKVHGMHQLGINVIPQKIKYNGFEKIKDHFKELTGDGWSFEKMFRHPNLKYFDEYNGVLDLDEAMDNRLKRLYYNNRKLFTACAD